MSEISAQHESWSAEVHWVYQFIEVLSGAVAPSKSSLGLSPTTPPSASRARSKRSVVLFSFSTFCPALRPNEPEQLSVELILVLEIEVAGVFLSGSYAVNPPSMLRLAPVT